MPFEELETPTIEEEKEYSLADFEEALSLLENSGDSKTLNKVRIFLDEFGGVDKRMAARNILRVRDRFLEKNNSKKREKTKRKALIEAIEEFIKGAERLREIESRG